MREMNRDKEVRADKKGELIKSLNGCLNILRDNEGLTGEKALRNMSYFLILKLIEQHFGKEKGIDIDNFEYDFHHIEDDNRENHKTKLLQYVRFSNLVGVKEDDITTYMKYLWDDVLSKHPSTKNIFLEGKGFDIQHQSTYKNIMNKLKTLPDTDNDILGDAYEEIIKGIMTGKVLGQFFTPPSVKKIMVKLIDPQIYPDGRIETCCDPTMGTGGFLITYLKNIMEQAETKNIKLDWDFIKSDGLYGKELEPDTYQLAVSNMFITSGHMFEKLDRGDSIRDPIVRKFDTILANPPFGIKGLKFDEYNSLMKDKYTPIRSDNAVSLFTQAIIHMLNINGKCAVVFPDGKELFSKTDKTLIAIREYLLKTCDVKEVIYLPSGVFTNTPIKTCIFYFVKKREGKDVLETKINISRTHKETGRDYKFSKTHQTTTVKFYDYNPYEDVKNLLVEVHIDKLANNSYSLNYAEYMKDETDEEQYEEGVIVKTLGEVCDFQNGKRIVKGQVETGKYPVLGGGGFTSFYTNEYSREGKTCKISREGMSLHNCVMILNEKYYLNSQGFTINSKNDNMMINEYLWYYLDNNKEQVFKCGRGTAQKAIDIDEFKSIKIPIPSLDKQQEIVKYLDFIYEKANKTSNEKIAELKMLNKFCLNNQKIFGENVVKMLGEVCKFKNGKGIKKDTLVEGDYPVIGGGQKPMGFHNEYNTYENTILCSSSGAYAGFISKYDKRVWASDCFSIIPKDIINNNYLYYLLKMFQDKIYKLQTGTAQPHIYSKDLEQLKIPIPSLERQKEFVEYCENNDLLIKHLEKEIESNKKQATLFMATIIKSPEDK